VALVGRRGRELLVELDALARESAFSGVVRIDRGDTTEFAQAYGRAHRALAVPNTLDTQSAIASGSKALTALTVVRLIQDGALGL
jgi:CubicO group peptidase (beta-lactamase class C family)